MTDTKCEACATQGPLVEALTRDNQRLREDIATVLLNTRQVVAIAEARAEKAEAECVRLRERAEAAEKECRLLQRLEVEPDGEDAAFALAERAIVDAKKAEARVAELEAALREAATVFRGCAKHHRLEAERCTCGAVTDDECTARKKERFEKARANDEHADRIEKVLAHASAEPQERVINVTVTKPGEYQVRARGSSLVFQEALKK